MRTPPKLAAGGANVFGALANLPGAESMAITASDGVASVGVAGMGVADDLLSGHYLDILDSAGVAVSSQLLSRNTTAAGTTTLTPIFPFAVTPVPGTHRARIRTHATTFAAPTGFTHIVSGVGAITFQRVKFTADVGIMGVGGNVSLGLAGCHLKSLKTAAGAATLFNGPLDASVGSFGANAGGPKDENGDPIIDSQIDNGGLFLDGTTPPDWAIFFSPGDASIAVIGRRASLQVNGSGRALNLYGVDLTQGQVRSTRNARLNIGTTATNGRIHGPDTLGRLSGVECFEKGFAEVLGGPRLDISHWTHAIYAGEHTHVEVQGCTGSDNTIALFAAWPHSSIQYDTTCAITATLAANFASVSLATSTRAALDASPNRTLSDFAIAGGVGAVIHRT